MHTLLVTSANNLPICGTHPTLDQAIIHARTMAASYPEIQFRISWVLPLDSPASAPTATGHSPVPDLITATEIDRLATRALTHARMNVAPHLRNLRLQSGVTMPALAKHLGFSSPSHIHDIEHGRRLWTLDMAQAAEQYLLSLPPTPAPTSEKERLEP